ncbi:hypothetical protein QUV44_02565 [Parasutterella secunda]|uniref:lipopolysaccharide biosynthesis protein n=1 Tax=Parasutterella secunda TaxID=626947 RepID=UPI0025A42C27|nr:hypothetical protein [Parasutterella secunda]MDM8087085.1 hypothetical protein [Parasutterella secunda]
MAEVSRTARVIQNAKVALFFYCINLILQFFSRKIFLDYLGAELLGLNTTAQNLLQFLNLAESGIGAAVAFALYKPLSQNNRQEIIDIVSLLGWFYRWVGLFVIAGSIVLMAFFPWIFAKAEVPLMYAYGTFIAFLISALLGYFVNYKMIVLSADQKEYQITIETQSVKVAKIFIQMLAICFLSDGYVWWMVVEALAAILVSIKLNVRVNKEYPWLTPKLVNAQDLQKEYPYILKKVQQLFFHKIAEYALWLTTPLVVYSFTSMTMVAIYGNYVTIMGGCLALVDAFSRGFYAGVGSLVVQGDRDSIRKTYLEILTIRLFLAGMISAGIYFLSESFVTLWVGRQYLMADTPMILMIFIYFIQMSRSSDLFLRAYGLFQDIWAPILECVLNVGLSILFGYFWGLTGILLAVLLSQVVIVLCWKVYFLCSRGFRESVKLYVVTYIKKMFLLFCTIFLIKYSFGSIDFNISGFVIWIKVGIAYILAFSLVGGILFYCCDENFRAALSRIYSRYRVR